MFTQDTVVAWSNVMWRPTIPPGMCLPPGTCVQGKGVACNNVQLCLCKTFCMNHLIIYL